MAKNLDKEVRTRNILDAARQEFVEKGYDRVSMEHIAGRAGLSKGGLYHHFESKDEILVAINDSFLEPISQAMRGALEQSSCAESLRYYIGACLRYWMDHPSEIQLFLMFMTRAMTNTSMWTGLREYYVQELSFLEGLYAAGMEQGEFAPLDFRGMGIALASALDGIIPFLLASKDLSPDEVLEVFDKIFIRNLSPIAPAPKG